MEPTNNEESWIEELMRLADEDPKMTEKQSQIVRAAIEIFSEKGYSASSTSEIAQKAGVAEGTIFKHYKTKKDLLISIVSPIAAKIIAPLVLKDVFKLLDASYPRFEDFLRAIIKNRMEFVKKNLPVIRILVQEIPFHPELRGQFRNIVESNLLPKILDLVKRFQSRGLVKAEVPPLSVIRLTITTGIGFLFARYILLPDLPWDDEAEMERTIQFILHGIAGPNERSGSL